MISFGVANVPSDLSEHPLASLARCKFTIALNSHKTTFDLSRQSTDSPLIAIGKNNRAPWNRLTNYFATDSLETKGVLVLGMACPGFAAGLSKEDIKRLRRIWESSSTTLRT
jgi:hypothetical protein